MGMSTETGRTIRGLDELRQVVRDVLTTRIGTRVLNRTYGCRIWDYVDAPLNPGTALAMQGAVAEAIVTWVPDVRRRDGSRGPERVSVSGSPDGETLVTVYGFVDGAKFESVVNL